MIKLSIAMAQSVRSVGQKRVSLALCVGYLLGVLKWLAIIVAGLATWAQLRNAEFASPDTSDWLFWVLIVASIFAASDPGSLLRRKTRVLQAADARANYLVQGLHEIRAVLQPKKNGVSIVKAQECLLHAAAYDLREALNLNDHEELRTNLVIALPPKQFQVVARSRPGSALATYTMSSKAAVTQAMESNRTVAVPNAQPLIEGDHRSYKCVVATPITSGKNAFGAISADCIHPRVFKGREKLVDQILRPYAAAILLTLVKNPAAYACPEKHE